MSTQEWLNTFAMNLREIMIEKGYNQEQLAGAIGVSQSSVSGYLNARQMPTIKAIINMSYELDEDLTTFIDFGDILY